MDENLRLLKSDPLEEIVFFSPHEKGSFSKLWLTNPGKQNVYFKVLTTDPLAFCVKPKMGRILPGETAEVCITLRNDDPKFYLEKQPKFKILTVENSEDDGDPKQLWNGDKSDMSFLRFSCNFIDPDPADKFHEDEILERRRDRTDSHSNNFDTSASSESINKDEASLKKKGSKEYFGVTIKHVFMILFAIVIAYIATSTVFKKPVSL